MVRKALLAALAAVCLVIPAVGQVAGDYLDVYMVNIKPEKQADFEALAAKMADANRKHNGDRWLAVEGAYGDPSVAAFISTRNSYAEIDKAENAFMAALHKAYGEATAKKMMGEWSNCVSSSRVELRRRRWDLSRKAPADAAAYAKLVGQARVMRTTAVHVRPGRIADFEAMMKDVKEAAEKNDSTQTVLVSQVVEGGNGTVFYVTSLRPGLDGFDKNPTARDILGEEGYKKYLQAVAETVESANSMILRYSAEMSAPPDAIAAIAPDFWNPKPPAAAKAKTKTETPKQ